MRVDTKRRHRVPCMSLPGMHPLSYQRQDVIDRGALVPLSTIGSVDLSLDMILFPRHKRVKWISEWAGRPITFWTRAPELAMDFFNRFCVVVVVHVIIIPQLLTFVHPYFGGE